MGRVHHIVGTEVMKRTAFPGGGASVDRRFQLVQQAYQPGGPRGEKAHRMMGSALGGGPLPCRIRTYTWQVQCSLGRELAGAREGWSIMKGQDSSAGGGEETALWAIKDKTDNRWRSRRCCRERPRYRFQARMQDRTIRKTTSLMGGRETVHLARQ